MVRIIRLLCAATSLAAAGVGAVGWLQAPDTNRVETVVELSEEAVRLSAEGRRLGPSDGPAGPMAEGGQSVGVTVEAGALELISAPERVTLLRDAGDDRMKATIGGIRVSDARALREGWNLTVRSKGPVPLRVGVVRVEAFAESTQGIEAAAEHDFDQAGEVVVGAAKGTPLGSWDVILQISSPSSGRELSAETALTFELASR